MERKVFTTRNKTHRDILIEYWGVKWDSESNRYYICYPTHGEYIWLDEGDVLYFSERGLLVRVVKKNEQTFICGLCGDSFERNGMVDSETCIECKGPMCYDCWDDEGQCCFLD